MGDLPLFDAAASRGARDEGITRVADHNQNFMILAFDEILRLRSEHDGEVFVGEDLRAALIEKGIVPSKPHAWGALINQLIKRNLIVPTGIYLPMRDVKSHARKTSQYRWG